MQAPLAERKRILFVDDEPAVLASLECVLRRDRARWDMVFVSGGSRALHEIRHSTFDAIVCDMQMPDLDGATLMSLIEREQPSTVRIILTAYANDLDLDRAAPAVHELLTKPCRIDELRTVLEFHLGAPPDDPRRT